MLLGASLPLRADDALGLGAGAGAGMDTAPALLKRLWEAEGCRAEGCRGLGLGLGLLNRLLGLPPGVSNTEASEAPAAPSCSPMGPCPRCSWSSARSLGAEAALRREPLPMTAPF
jgi:hypothetical protein